MDNHEKALERLQKSRDSGSSLPKHLELYEKLLHLQDGAKRCLPARQGVITPDQAVHRLQEGLPLLAWEDVSLAWPAFRDLFRAISLTVGEFREDISGDLERAAGLGADYSLLAGAAKAWYEGLALSSWTDSLGIAEELLSEVMCLTFRPFLTTCSKPLSQLVVQEKWRRGYCPICGGKPDFALLDREQGARWLLCWRCDAQWLFQRLQCPFCGTRDQDTLAYFPDADGVHRIYVCEQCHSYLKAIDARRTDSEVLLSVERALTVELDIQAQRVGYIPGWIVPPRAG